MRTLSLVLALVLVAPFALSVSSSEALEALGACLKANNPQIQPLGQPFYLDNVGYWVFHYPLGSSKKTLAAVDQDDGRVLSENQALTRLAGGVYDHLVLESFIKAKGWSADGLDAAFASTSDVIDDQYGKLQVFHTQTLDQYPDLGLDAVELRLDALRTQADLVRLQLSSTISEEQFYSEDRSDASAKSVVAQYGASFSALFDFFDAYDAYAKSITDAERKIYQLGIPDPDNRNINTNLENLRDVGVSNLYAKAKAQDPRKALSQLQAQKDSWVKDSVDSFAFQDLSCRANAAYEDAFKQYAQIQSAEKNLAAAGFSREISQLKSDFSQIENAKNQRNQDGYQFVLDHVAQIKADMTDLRARYEKLTAGPTATPAPQQKGVDFSVVIAVVLVAVLAAYGYQQYKKKQEEEG
ncbi:MAG: hypothetical protein Q8P02_03050 [Candidatus Micrarchaeota archaeon]|nr:hypothetical protein [Candidatus Micrarchaeota archaeon]